MYQTRNIIRYCDPSKRYKEAVAMQVGDFVRGRTDGDYLGLARGKEGVITRLEKCDHNGCPEMAISFDPPDGKVFIYWHAASFEVVKPE